MTTARRILVLLLLGTGCSLSALDGYSGPTTSPATTTTTPTTNDGGIESDGAIVVVPDAAEEAAAPLPNILVNSEFSEGAGCGGHYRTSTNLDPVGISTDSNAGGFACRLCKSGGWMYHDEVPVSGAIRKYKVVIRYRTESNSGDELHTEIGLEVGESDVFRQTAEIPLSKDWREETLVGTIPERSMTVGAGVDVNGVGCLVVDRLEVIPVP